MLASEPIAHFSLAISLQRSFGGSDLPRVILILIGLLQKLPHRIQQNQTAGDGLLHHPQPNAFRRFHESARFIKKIGCALQ